MIRTTVKVRIKIVQCKLHGTRTEKVRNTNAAGRSSLKLQLRSAVFLHEYFKITSKDVFAFPFVSPVSAY